MQPHNYFLVLFKKDIEGTPKPQGQRKIERVVYEQLCSDIFKEFAAGETVWEIKERRIFELPEQRQMFEKEEYITVNCFIVIDAVIKK